MSQFTGEVHREFRLRGFPQTFRQDDWPPGLAGYDFDLPAELIAQAPAPQREDSRLLVVRRNPGPGLPQFEDLNFKDLPALVQSENLNQSLWVRNRTRVFEARLYAHRPSGSLHEIVLLRQESPGRWQALIRNVKRFEFPQTLHLAGDPSITLTSPAPGIIEFSREGPDVFEICRRHGEMPLPPYIKERSKTRDVERYQSVWAHSRPPASVAAPTASLHFSQNLCAELQTRGVEFVDIELEVGLGTFEPLRSDTIDANELHREHFTVPAPALRQLESGLAADTSFFCVGTTAMRCLESLPLGACSARTREFAFGYDGELSGETSIFIKPGTDVRYTSQLLTNFHLPQSSLFVLVSTFAGSPTLAREAYRHAILKKYRFFSYGDATLWL